MAMKKAATKTPAKRASAKKATAKRATAKRATAKKAATKKAATKKVATKKVPAKKASAKKASAKAATQASESASRLIDARIASLDDWRGATLARVRALIRKADPAVVEEWKWRGVPVWSHDGILCTGETYTSVVKLTFAKGASLDDPAGLFNSSLEGNTRRAIDLHEGDALDEAAFKALVRAAVARNAK